MGSRHEASVWPCIVDTWNQGIKKVVLPGGFADATYVLIISPEMFRELQERDIPTNGAGRLSILRRELSIARVKNPQRRLAWKRIALNARTTDRLGFPWARRSTFPLFMHPTNVRSSI